MDDDRDLLLHVWREVCRHLEVAQSAQTILGLLVRRLPVELLGVVSLDLARGSSLLRTAGCRGAEPRQAARTRPLDGPDGAILRAWVPSGRVIWHGPGTEEVDPPLRVLLGGAPATGSWLVGPLAGEHGATGALLLRAHPPAPFGPAHAGLVGALLEPFAAALDNEARLHELQALRAAAEADKHSALSRLGRAELVDAIVGADAGLKAVMERVALVARADLPVLILGETGSGKEVIARAIHEQSARARAPFVRVNCGAIPPELIDSELFGHEKGAFTGAVTARRGWFERADGGTLLLDEIGELPLPAQVRLLRVLQEGAFDRVGADRSTYVDVRIVASTHRDLPGMVQEGRFRADLWYRVGGFPIVLPPLRERRQDIPALAEHFARRAARRFGLRPQSPQPEDLARLVGYDWPGNIRELASVIDRAAILGDGATLEIAKALGDVGATDGWAAPTSSAPAPNPAGQPLPLDQATRRHIEAALAATRGRIEGERGAAALLRINPHTLRARMRKLGIEWARYR